jgi:hypothetical protein
MALQRRGSTQKVLVSVDALSRAAIRSETRRFSSTGFKQEPAKVQILACKIKGAQQKPKGASRKLTLQLLASRFYDSNKERVAFFEMNNHGCQIRHLIFKQRHPLRQAKRFPSLIHSFLRLAL